MKSKVSRHSYAQNSPARNALTTESARAADLSLTSADPPPVATSPAPSMMGRGASRLAILSRMANQQLASGHPSASPAASSVTTETIPVESMNSDQGSAAELLTSETSSSDFQGSRAIDDVSLRLEEERLPLAPDVVQKNELLQHGEISTKNTNKESRTQEAISRLNQLTHPLWSHSERSKLLFQLQKSVEKGEILEQTYLAYADGLMRDNQNNSVLDLTNLGGVVWQLRLLPQQHNLGRFRALLSQTQDPRVLAALAREITELAQEQQLEVFSTILDSTQDPTVLKALASVVDWLPKDHILEGLNAILEKIQDPTVLRLLAGKIGFLPNDHMLEGFNAVLEKSKDPRVLERLILSLWSMPKGQRIEGFNAFLNSTSDPTALKALAENLHALPQEQNLRGFKAILNSTQDPRVLVVLTARLHPHLGDDIHEGFIAFTEKSQDPRVLENLAKIIRFLPKDHRLEGFIAVLEKTQDPRVLENLAKNIYFLPQDHRVLPANLHELIL